MKRLASVLGMIAIALTALLVVPTATAGAQPAAASGVDNGNVRVSAVNDYQTVLVQLRKGSIKQVGNSVLLQDAKGKTTDRVPLTVKGQDGKAIPVRAQVAADGKSAEFTPLASKHDVAKRKQGKKMTKAQAYDDMMRKANKHWACASPAVIIGGIIGFFIFWPITLPLGLAIGANIGYGNCGVGKQRGEAVTAFWKWYNTPG